MNARTSLRPEVTVWYVVRQGYAPYRIKQHSYFKRLFHMQFIVFSRRSTLPQQLLYGVNDVLGAAVMHIERRLILMMLLFFARS